MKTGIKITFFLLLALGGIIWMMNLLPTPEITDQDVKSMMALIAWVFIILIAGVWIECISENKKRKAFREQLMADHFKQMEEQNEGISQRTDQKTSTGDKGCKPISEILHRPTRERYSE